jgi:hypothetical protein
MADNQVDLKLNLDFKGVNDALYQMIGDFKGTDKEFEKIAASIQKNANKLEASILVFGPASKQAAASQKALQANMLSLVANGVNPQIAAVATLSQNYNSLNGILATTQSATNGATSAISNSANSLKQSNKQWMALSLVVQDLPYGFRGIQNNLPALFGSLATGAGAAYFAFSAVVAVITAMDMGLIKFGQSVKLTTDYSKEAADTYATETVQLDSLYRVSQDVTVSMDDRLSAAQSLIKEYPGLLESYSAEDIALGKAAESYDKLREAVWAYAKVKAAEKVLIELGGKQNELTIKQNKVTAQQNKADIKGLTAVNYAMYNNLSITEQFYKFVNDLPVNGAFGPIVNALPEMQKTTELLSGIKKEQEDLNDETKLYQDIIDNNIVFAKLFEDSKNGGKKGAKEKVDTSALDNLKIQQKYYKDDLAMFYEYGRLIIKEEERLALEKANFEKKSEQEIKNIKAAFQTQMLVNQQEFGRALMSIADKNTKEYEKNEEEIAKIIISSREQIADAIKRINSDMNTENIKNVQTELDQTLKATRGNYNAQKEAYQIAIDKLKEKKAALDEAGISSEEYRKKIENLQAGLGGLVDPLETLSQTLQSTFSQMNIDLVTGFAESIGEMLAGGKFDFTKLGNILADGLSSIGKALIAFALTNGAAINLFKDPKTWPLALAAGIAAVTAGSFLKNSINENKATAFANGGIVSGPTMGLVGEYPGAQNNPEVIAPLDKLKSMIGGGGGGTFVLRGQDLLVSINRTQKSSFLKGQNISLA